VAVTPRISTSGAAEWRAALRHKGTQVHKATRVATRQSKTLLERQIKQTLRRRSHKRGTPTPAPPGEPPAKISGHLARSVKGRGPQLVRRGVWSAEVGPTAVYSRIQELGGTTGRHHRTHLPARPYVKPTVHAEFRHIREIYRRAWAEAILS